MKFKPIHFLSLLCMFLSWLSKQSIGTSLGVQGLRICPSSAGDVGLIPGWGTEILHATGQLSPLAITREKLECGNKESLHAATKTPCSQIYIYI